MKIATVKPKKMVLIGVAGTATDFLLALHTLKCYLYEDEDIKKSGIDVVLRQYCYIPSDQIERKASEILKELEEEEPDIVGFSCYVWNIDVVKYISKRVKQKNKDVKIIIGGPEIAREDITGIIDNLSADYFIFGEGEKPLLILVKHLLGLNASIEDVKGLAYKRNEEIVCALYPDFIENLDKVTSPYLTGFVSDDILSRPDIRVNIETQRGCNFRCAYCFYHKGFPRIRYRDARMVIDEIEYVYHKGIKIGRILDANFLSDREFAKDIIRGMIARNIKMSFFFEMLPQFLDEEISQLFGEYVKKYPENRLMAGMGVQTLNQESLTLLRRQISVSQFEKAFNLLQKANVIIKSDIILGLPRETKETYLKTLEFITEKMRHGTNYLSLSLLRILPGTDLVEIAKRENIMIDTRDSLHFAYTTPSMPRKDMVECLRLNTAAIRLLSSVGIQSRVKLRDLYFNVKDTLRITNVNLIQYFAKEIFEYLNNTTSDYVQPDFPNAEFYSYKSVYQEVPDKWLIKKLKDLKNYEY